jgi:hypothetical protein
MTRSAISNLVGLIACLMSTATLACRAPSESSTGPSNQRLTVRAMYWDAESAASMSESKLAEIPIDGDASGVGPFESYVARDEALVRDYTSAIEAGERSPLSSSMCFRDPRAIVDISTGKESSRIFLGRGCGVAWTSQRVCMRLPESLVSRAISFGSQRLRNSVRWCLKEPVVPVTPENPSEPLGRSPADK